MQKSDQEALRSGLQNFAEASGLTIAGWCRVAGVNRTTLVEFLAGRSKRIGFDFVKQLADAANTDIATIESFASPEAVSSQMRQSTSKKRARRAANPIVDLLTEMRDELREMRRELAEERRARVADQAGVAGRRTKSG